LNGFARSVRVALFCREKIFPKIVFFIVHRLFSSQRRKRKARFPAAVGEFRGSLMHQPQAIAGIEGQDKGRRLRGAGIGGVAR
jgi:hypothetical protein